MLLDTPVTVGGMTLKNSIAMPPMATHRSPDGLSGDDICAHYRARAAAGTALISSLITQTPSSTVAAQIPLPQA